MWTGSDRLRETRDEPARHRALTVSCQETQMTRSEMHVLKRLERADGPLLAPSLPNGNGHCDASHNRFASGGVLRQLRKAGLIRWIQGHPHGHGYLITDAGRAALEAGE